MRCKPLPAPCIATRQPPLLQRLQRRSGRAARTCSCARFFSRRCAGASSRKLAFSEAPLQRHIASHLSSTAVAPEDLNYPECLTGTQSSEQAHAAISSDAPPAACSPAHVFPVLAASLAFLRRTELALETPVFEKLVGEVMQRARSARNFYSQFRFQILQEACSYISSSQVAISARSGKIHGLLFACRSLLQLREATQVLPARAALCHSSLRSPTPVAAGYRCRAVRSPSKRRLQVPRSMPVRFAALTAPALSNLWGVFKQWWRHHGPLFSFSGENAFYQLWQQAVPTVTMVRAFC